MFFEDTFDTFESWKCRFCDEFYPLFNEKVKHESTHSLYVYVKPEVPENGNEKVDSSGSGTSTSSVPVTNDKNQNQLMDIDKDMEDNADNMDFDFDDMDFDDTAMDFSGETLSDLDLDQDIIEELLHNISINDSALVPSQSNSKRKIQKKWKDKDISFVVSRGQRAGCKKREDELVIAKRRRNYDFHLDQKIIEGITHYRCRICLKMTKQKVNHFNHLLWHNKERPYSCQFCQKLFTQNNSRFIHEKICKKRPTAIESSSKMSSGSKNEEQSVGSGSETDFDNSTTNDNDDDVIETVQILKFPCSTCALSFEDSRTRNKHQRLCKPNDPLKKAATTVKAKHLNNRSVNITTKVLKEKAQSLKHLYKTRSQKLKYPNMSKSPIQLSKKGKKQINTSRTRPKTKDKSCDNDGSEKKDTKLQLKKGGANSDKDKTNTQFKKFKKLKTNGSEKINTKLQLKKGGANSDKAHKQFKKLNTYGCSLNNKAKVLNEKTEILKHPYRTRSKKMKIPKLLVQSLSKKRNIKPKTRSELTNIKLLELKKASGKDKALTQLKTNSLKFNFKSKVFNPSFNNKTQVLVGRTRILKHPYRTRSKKLKIHKRLLLGQSLSKKKNLQRNIKPKTKPCDNNGSDHEMPKPNTKLEPKKDGDRLTQLKSHGSNGKLILDKKELFVTITLEDQKLITDHQEKLEDISRNNQNFENADDDRMTDFEVSQPQQLEMDFKEEFLQISDSKQNEIESIDDGGKSREIIDDEPKDIYYPNLNGGLPERKVSYLDFEKSLAIYIPRLKESEIVKYDRNSTTLPELEVNNLDVNFNADHHKDELENNSKNNQNFEDRMIDFEDPQTQDLELKDFKEAFLQNSDSEQNEIESIDDDDGKSREIIDSIGSGHEEDIVDPIEIYSNSNGGSDSDNEKDIADPLEICCSNSNGGSEADITEPIEIYCPNSIGVSDHVEDITEPIENYCPNSNGALPERKVSYLGLDLCQGLVIRLPRLKECEILKYTRTSYSTLPELEVSKLDFNFDTNHHKDMENLENISRNSQHFENAGVDQDRVVDFEDSQTQDIEKAFKEAFLKICEPEQDELIGSDHNEEDITEPIENYCQNSNSVSELDIAEPKEIYCPNLNGGSDHSEEDITEPIEIYCPNSNSGSDHNEEDISEPIEIYCPNLISVSELDIAEPVEIYCQNSIGVSEVDIVEPIEIYCPISNGWSELDITEPIEIYCSNSNGISGSDHEEDIADPLEIYCPNLNSGSDHDEGIVQPIEIYCQNSNGGSELDIVEPLEMYCQNSNSGPDHNEEDIDKPIEIYCQNSIGALPERKFSYLGLDLCQSLVICLPRLKESEILKYNRTSYSTLPELEVSNLDFNQKRLVVSLPRLSESELLKYTRSKTKSISPSQADQIIEKYSPEGDFITLSEDSSHQCKTCHIILKNCSKLNLMYHKLLHTRQSKGLLVKNEVSSTTVPKAKPAPQNENELERVDNFANKKSDLTRQSQTQDKMKMKAVGVGVGLNYSGKEPGEITITRPSKGVQEKENKFKVLSSMKEMKKYDRKGFKRVGRGSSFVHECLICHKHLRKTSRTNLYLHRMRHFLFPAKPNPSNSGKKSKQSRHTSGKNNLQNSSRLIDLQKRWSTSKFKLKLKSNRVLTDINSGGKDRLDSNQKNDNDNVNVNDNVEQKLTIAQMMRYTQHVQVTLTRL